MNFYLSSYNFGNEIEKLKTLIPSNKKIALIDNAKDAVGFDPELRKNICSQQIEQLHQIGFLAEELDLKDYFGKETELRKELNTFGAVWITGGNTFVLRAAMKLSGFDKVIKEISNNDDFLYGGYSAGICVLSASLKGLEVVDKPNEFPYPEIKEPIWEGLGFFGHLFLPHYKSDHHESADIDKTVDFCINNQIPYQTLTDGDVIIIQN
jgi:dipeptidase E